MLKRRRVAGAKAATKLKRFAALRHKTLDIVRRQTPEERIALYLAMISFYAAMQRGRRVAR